MINASISFHSKCNQSGFVNFDFAVNWIRSQNQRYISVDFSPSCFILFPHQVVMHQDIYLIYTCKQSVFFFIESNLLSHWFISLSFTSLRALIEWDLFKRMVNFWWPSTTYFWVSAKNRDIFGEKIGREYFWNRRIRNESRNIPFQQKKNTHLRVCEGVHIFMLKLFDHTAARIPILGQILSPVLSQKHYIRK